VCDPSTCIPHSATWGASQRTAEQKALYWLLMPMKLDLFRMTPGSSTWDYKPILEWLPRGDPLGLNCHFTEKKFKHSLLPWLYLHYLFVTALFFRYNLPVSELGLQHGSLSRPPGLECICMSHWLIPLQLTLQRLPLPQDSPHISQARFSSLLWYPGYISLMAFFITLCLPH
jgi:hypothetical protein